MAEAFGELFLLLFKQVLFILAPVAGILLIIRGYKMYREDTSDKREFKEYKKELKEEFWNGEHRFIPDSGQSYDAEFMRGHVGNDVMYYNTQERQYYTEHEKELFDCKRNNIFTDYEKAEIADELAERQAKLLDYLKQIAELLVDDAVEDIKYLSNKEYVEIIKQDYELGADRYQDVSMEDNRMIHAQMVDLGRFIKQVLNCAELCITNNRPVIDIVGRSEYPRYKSYDLGFEKVINNISIIRKADAMIGIAIEAIKEDHETIKESLSEINGALRGQSGEDEVLTHITAIKGENWEIFDGLVIPGFGDRKTAEMDVCVVCEYGLFVIEIKNYMFGELYVSKEGYAKHVLRDGSSNDDDVIEQNEYHITALSNLLSKRGMRPEEFIRSIIVIPNNKLLVNNQSDYPIIYTSLLRREITEKNRKIIAVDDIKSIASILKSESLRDNKFEHRFKSLRLPLEALREWNNIYYGMRDEDFLR